MPRLLLYFGFVAPFGLVAPCGARCTSYDHLPFAMNTLNDYNRFLADIRKYTGIEALKPDDSGLASVRVDDTYNVNFQFIEATGKVLCFIEVAELQTDAPKAVYRDLLAGGLFGKDTAGGYFALEPETETVVYNYFFDLEAAAKDVEDFIHTVEKILQLCDIWAERIKEGLGEHGGSGAEEHLPHHFRIDA